MVIPEVYDHHIKTLLKAVPSSKEFTSIKESTQYGIQTLLGMYPLFENPIPLRTIQKKILSFHGAMIAHPYPLLNTTVSNDLFSKVLYEHMLTYRE